MTPPDGPAAHEALPEVVAEACARADRPGGTVEDGTQAAILLLFFGYVDRARDMLLRLAGRQPVGQLALLRMCRYLATGAKLLDSVPEHRLAVMVAHNPEARRVILVFPGIGPRFWGMVEDVFLYREDASFVFLRDLDGLFYLDGIAGLGRNYPDCLHRLRVIIGAIGNSGPVHCIGHSVGGYAALRYGLDLGAHAVLSFSGPTTLALDDRPAAVLATEPLLQALYRRVPDMVADLHGLYAAASSPPKAVLCYGANNEQDRAAALHMQDLSCVTLEPLAEYEGHASVLEATLRGRFNSLVERVLAL